MALTDGALPRVCPVRNTNLGTALVTSEKREWSLVLEDAATRYRRFLADFPGIESHLKMADVATYLGVAAETLSRIRKNLTSS